MSDMTVDQAMAVADERWAEVLDLIDHPDTPDGHEFYKLALRVLHDEIVRLRAGSAPADRPTGETPAEPEALSWLQAGEAMAEYAEQRRQEWAIEARAARSEAQEPER